MKISMAAVLLMLVGCAHPEYDRMQAVAEAQAKNVRIECKDPATCATKWARALQWVSENAPYKLRIANESIIVTEGPLDTSATTSLKSAMTINKVPRGDGTSTIIFKSVCANRFGCVPSHEMLFLNFAKFVNGE